MSEPFPPTALRRHHTQTVRDSSSSYKIDYVIVIKNFLNPEGHQNSTSTLKVTAILLKGWILPIGGALAGEALPCSLRSRLVLILTMWFAGQATKSVKYVTFSHLRLLYKPNKLQPPIIGSESYHKVTWRTAKMGQHHLHSLEETPTVSLPTFRPILARFLSVIGKGGVTLQISWTSKLFSDTQTLLFQYMWHMTHDCGRTFSQNFSLPALTILNERINQLLNHWMNELVTKVFIEQPRLQRVC